MNTKEIDQALNLILPGLEKYNFLQTRFQSSSIKDDFLFQRKFKGYYRMQRRSKSWYDLYFDLLSSKKDTDCTFEELLTIFHNKTNRFEASFISKMLATINTQMPVWDQFVLQNLNLKAPYYNTKNRLKKIVKTYDDICTGVEEIKASDHGEYIIAQFKTLYPEYRISEIKMIDFVLWKIRNN